ncbi:biopolymer transporter ExbD [Lentisphaerota bacterium WC36G]|nr:biopolymer transporter ExbD [Lentisphaerae bacterium WC36]
MRLSKNKNSRFHFSDKTKIFTNRPDLTPLVDMMFLLLIFVMLSSSFLNVTGIMVEVPKVSNQTAMDMKKMIISIDKDNQIYFQNKQVSLKELQRNLLDLDSVIPSNSAVILSADKDSKSGIMTKIYSLADKANLDLFVLTDEEKAQSEVVYDKSEVE